MTDEIKRPKRPRDANQLAKSIVDIATGEKEEVTQKSTRQSHAGAIGGRARAESLSSKARSEIAKKAALVRWGGSVARDEEG